MHTKTFSSNLQSLRELEEMGGAVEMLFLRHTLKIKPSGNNFQRGNWGYNQRSFCPSANTGNS